MSAVALGICCTASLPALAQGGMMQNTDATLEMTPANPAFGINAPAAITPSGQPSPAGDDSAGAGLQNGNRQESRPARNPLIGRVVNTKTGMRDIGDTAKKLRRETLTTMGELTRFNLLWGHAPTNNKGNILWGGALTKEQVEAQYRQLPSLVFTAPNYVKFFSYPLPPRKKMLLAYTRQLGELVNMLLADIVDTGIPPEKENEVAASWTELNKLAKDIESQYMNEYNLVENTSDDRLQKSIADDQRAFGEPLVAIYNDTGKIQNMLKDMSDALKGGTETDNVTAPRL